MKPALFVSIAALFSAISGPSHGAVLWTFSEVGGDLVSRYYGTLDVAGVDVRQASNGDQAIAPPFGFSLNRPGVSELDFLLASGPEYWPLIGVGYTQTAGYGDAFGVYGDDYFLGYAGIFVKRGYVSGSEIRGGQIFAGGRFSDFDLSVGDTFVYTLDSGDTVTVAFTSELLEFPEVASVPVPAAMPLLLAGLGAGALIARRKARIA